MNSLLAPLLSYVLLYKYWTIFGAVFISAIVVPLPTNAMLLAAGAFASQGYMNFWGILVVAQVANILGDFTDYLLANVFGERIIRAFHIKKSKFFLQLENELRVDAKMTVFTTRFAGTISPLANLLAGLVGVPAATFLIFDALGNGIEIIVVVVIGYLVGNYWDDFSGPLGVFAGIIAVSITLFVLYKVHRRMTKRYEDDQ